MTPGATSRLRAARGRNNEGLLAVVLLVLVLGMSLANPVFFTLPTVFAIIRGSIVPTILALGVLVVIISGGIDVSFATIATFAAYSTVRIMESGAVGLGLVGAFALALALGAVLGLLNGAVIAGFGLPTLIVTLGTQGIFRGVLFTYVGSVYVADLPPPIAAVSTSSVLTVGSGAGGASLHVMVVPAALLCVLVAWTLGHTMFGRSIFAMGDDAEAARRAGFRVAWTRVWIYVLVGMTAAAAGMIYTILGRSASPQDLLGSELDIIAAVVLGGASIFGGRGSVLGTVLGVLLVQVIDNSLILIGVPSAWQRAVIGILLILGVGVQAVAVRRAGRAVRGAPAPVVIGGAT